MNDHAVNLRTNLRTKLVLSLRLRWVIGPVACGVMQACGSPAPLPVLPHLIPRMNRPGRGCAMDRIGAGIGTSTESCSVGIECIAVPGLGDASFMIECGRSRGVGECICGVNGNVIGETVVTAGACQFDLEQYKRVIGTACGIKLP